MVSEPFHSTEHSFEQPMSISPDKKPHYQPLNQERLLAVPQPSHHLKWTIWVLSMAIVLAIGIKELFLDDVFEPWFITADRQTQLAHIFHFSSDQPSAWVDFTQSESIALSALAHTAPTAQSPHVLERPQPLPNDPVLNEEHPDEPGLYPTPAPSPRQSFETTQAAALSAKPLSVQEVLESLKISGIRLDGVHSRVLINSRTYELGDTIDGLSDTLRIVDIRARHIMLCDTECHYFKKNF